MSVAKRSDAYEPALPTSSLISASSCMAVGQPGRVELRDLAGVAAANAVARCTASSS